MFCAAKTGTFIFILVSHVSFQGQDVVSGLKPRQNYIDWQDRQEGWKVRITDIRSHPPTKETHFHWALVATPSMPGAAGVVVEGHLPIRQGETAEATQQLDLLIDTPDVF